MSSRGDASLYTPKILALAVDLASFPSNKDFMMRGEAFSRVCGSRVALGIEVDDHGAIRRVGVRVTACAIGQAAAAVFLRGAVNCDLPQISRARILLEEWLADDGSLPDWPGLEVLEPARGYPARHAALLLPWKAAEATLSNAGAAD